MTILLILVVYIALLVGFGLIINWFVAPLFGRWWRLVVAPGVIIHELAHVLGCVVTGAHVVEVNVWKSTGGHVLHTAPKLHLLGPVIISFAPTILMTALIVGGLPLVAPQLDLSWAVTFPTTIVGFLSGYLSSLWEAIRGLDWTQSGTWLFGYGILNAVVTITPSPRDFANAQWSLLVLLMLFVGLCAWLGVQPPIDLLWPPVATSLTLISLVCLAGVGSRLLMFEIKKALTPAEQGVGERD